MKVAICTHCRLTITKRARQPWASVPTGSTCPKRTAAPGDLRGRWHVPEQEDAS